HTAISDDSQQINSHSLSPAFAVKQGFLLCYVLDQISDQFQTHLARNLVEEVMDLQLNMVVHTVANLISLTALVEKVEDEGQWKQREDGSDYMDSGEEADHLIRNYKSPVPAEPKRHFTIIDVDKFEEAPSLSPNDLPEDFPLLNLLPGPASKCECHPSHLPSPDLEKRRCTGTLEEFTVVPQKHTEKALVKTYMAFRQWQLDRKKMGKQPEMEERFQILDHIKQRLLNAPNISDIQEEPLIPVVGPSRRNVEPKTVVPTITEVMKVALRGQRDTVKSKTKLQQDVYNLELQRQAEAIIHQVKEQAKKIKVKATELWDKWVTGKQQDTYQDNNNVTLNKVTHVVDNLLGETADWLKHNPQHKEEARSNVWGPCPERSLSQPPVALSTLENTPLGFKRINSGVENKLMASSTAFMTLQKHVANVNTGICTEK
ncbi:hypothetical protein EDD85DRAFT_975218, partial [Armillaria nabsnona]